MRGDIYHAGRALQAFRDKEGEDDLTGAMILADMADDIRQLRRIMESVVGIKRHESKG